MTTNNFYPKTDIQIGNAFELIHNLENNSVDCIVTSPPYYNLRNYETEPIIFDANIDCDHEWIEEITKLPNSQGGNSDKTNLSRKGKDNFQAFTEYNNRTVSSDFCQKCGAWKGQLGLEPTPELFISHLTQFFELAKPKLKHEGNLFVNLGDTYGTQSGTMLQGFNDANGTNKLNYKWLKSPMIKPKNNIVRHKNFCLIPERFAISMCDAGWILRNKIVWKKINNMPESITDRLTKSYKLIFHFVKQTNYYYDLDAIRIPHASESIERYQRNVNLGVNSITGKILQREEQNTGVPRRAPKWFRENDKPYAVQERTKETIEYRENLPSLSDLKTYLSTVKNGITIDEIESIFGNQAPHHWFSGESYPSSSDWMKLKSILNFDGTYDFVMTDIKTKSSEKQNNPLGKNPTDYHEIENNYDINELIAKWKELHPEDWNNPTDVWNISTKGYSGAHFATFPLKLIERPILAGCPPQGTVLDPFGGSGTVGEFCRFNNRNSIIFELNDSYKSLIVERTKSNSPHLLSFI